MKNILIASSSTNFIERNSTLLRRSDFRILSATDSAAALEILNQQLIDLVISDSQLEDMNGEVFCAKVREERACCNVRLILVFRDEPQEFERLRGCGADALVARPIKPLQLVKTVGQFLTIQLVRSRRVSLRVKVISKKDDVEFFCISHNISVTGMLIETEFSLEVGSIILCIFTMPGSVTVETEGEVVRTARGMDGSHQYGIQFITPSRMFRQEIDKYIESVTRSDLSSVS